jgi:hypothetical protein
MKFIAAFFVLPIFTIACGSSPAASTHDEVNSARQALGEGEDSETATVETATVEADESTPLALVAGDAGAPEAPEAAPEARVGDAGAPTPPSAADEGPAPVCTEGATQCAEQGVETCVNNAWTPSSTCEFWCTEGACNACNPGDSFGEIGAMYFCDEDGRLRQWDRPDLASYPINPGPASEYPDVSSLPFASDPPRWIRMVGSRWAEYQ